MNKFIPSFLIVLIFISCAKEVEVLDIPLTSKSPEAIEVLANELFFKKANVTGRIFNNFVTTALEEALEIDPDFVFAKALYSDSGGSLSNNERRALIESAYENRNTVSDIEKTLIEVIYFNTITGNKVQAAQLLDKVISENPQYYYLRVFNGVFQNLVMQNPKNAQANWQEALKINPDANIAKLLLAQLHFVTTPDFILLDNSEIDLEYAISMIKQVEKSQPKNFTPQRLLGNIYRLKGDFDLSLESYQKAMTLIENKKGRGNSTLYLVSGHVYLFKEDYEKAREYYKKSIETFSMPWNEINILAWSSNSYLYEKKYDQAIIAINEMEKLVADYEIDSLTRSNLMFRCAYEKFIAYGHSQMKEETQQVYTEMKKLNSERKSLRLANIKSESEKRNIELETELNEEFFQIWYYILFGEYQLARTSLNNYSLLSSEFLTYDSKAMVNFYKLSGYLNLMEGNVNQSISFYEQIPKELLEGDNYHLYFYALAKKANGNTKESDELLNYLANYNFAGWENSIIRPLAVQQIKG